jgi:peptidoglycan hydrolase-like protein with peptidoglycan-binding domain
VRKVQLALRSRGYYAGLIDGFIGQNTAIGIQRFQIDHDQKVIPVIDRSLLISLGIRGN